MKENSRNCLCSKMSMYALLDILAFYRDAEKFTIRVLLHPFPDQTTPEEPMTWSAMEKVGNRENLMRKFLIGNSQTGLRVRESLQIKNVKLIIHMTPPSPTICRIRFSGIMDTPLLSVFAVSRRFQPTNQC